MDAAHPCSKVVRFQERVQGEFQPPTPWVGRLSEAPILFIGSNPNISGREHYPTAGWADRDLIDFFNYAFDGEQRQIKDGIYPRRFDGSYGGWVRTWAGVRRRAQELLGRQPVPGLDYAMTELVRCRSWDETGVEEARNHCADMFLERTIEASRARVIVGLGAHVRQWLRSRWDIETHHVAPLDIGGEGRLVAFLPHPTGYGPKTFASVMPEELETLRRAVASHIIG